MHFTLPLRLGGERESIPALRKAYLPARRVSARHGTFARPRVFFSFDYPRGEGNEGYPATGHNHDNHQRTPEKRNQSTNHGRRTWLQ